MINVLSLFDGLSGARIALDQLGIECNYYASEIDKYAMQVSAANYPDIIQLGDITQVKAEDLPRIDLLIGGSPCQDLSVAKSGRQGLDGSRSGLFYEYIRLLRELKPKYFLLENVYSMPKESQKIISKEMGCSPIMINSALLTAQNRKRFYWTNTGVFMQPVDQGIVLADIIEDGDVDRDKSYCLDACYYKGTSEKHYKEKAVRQIVFKGCAKRPYPRTPKKGVKRTYEIEMRKDDKSNSVMTEVRNSGLVGIYTVPRGNNKGGARITDKAPAVTSNSFEHNNFYYTAEGIRKLTPRECERLQGIPDDYTAHVSNTQRYKMIGNGFTIPVIKYILGHCDFVTQENVT